MKIVTDHGMDLAAEQLEGLDINFVPLRIFLDGQTYVSGVDITSQDLYEKLNKSDSMPTTSQPSVGEFAEVYRKLAETDPDILSIHISSGLSGTINSARAAALLIPQANITHVDSKTLSCPFGWQVEAAACGVKAGWNLDRILRAMDLIRANSEGMFTLANLKYLIHGGRISHMKGLIASILNIKPVIGVEKSGGTYFSYGQEITLKKAIGKLVDEALRRYPEGTHMRVQLLHGNNPDGIEFLRQKMAAVFNCHWEPVTTVAAVLGAHTGPSVVGMAYGPMQIFSEI